MQILFDKSDTDDVETKTSFYKLYMLIFGILEQTWTTMQAGYMDFPKVITNTVIRTEEVLTRNVKNRYGLNMYLKEVHNLDIKFHPTGQKFTVHFADGFLTSIRYNPDQKLSDLIEKVTVHRALGKDFIVLDPLDREITNTNIKLQDLFTQEVKVVKRGTIPVSPSPSVTTTPVRQAKNTPDVLSSRAESAREKYKRRGKAVSASSIKEKISPKKILLTSRDRDSHTETPPETHTEDVKDAPLPLEVDLKKSKSSIEDITPILETIRNLLEKPQPSPELPTEPQGAITEPEFINNETEQLESVVSPKNSNPEGVQDNIPTPEKGLSRKIVSHARQNKINAKEKRIIRSRDFRRSLSQGDITQMMRNTIHN